MYMLDVKLCVSTYAERQCTNLCVLALYKLPRLGVVLFKESAHKIAVFLTYM